MCRLFLNEYFSRIWQGKDPVKEAFAITGNDYRQVKSRRTTRFEREGKGYFIKLHSGIGWKEYWKDLLQGKKPVTGAGNEFDALTLLHEKNVPTMTAAAFGCRGMIKAYEKSFLITEELCDVISLEDLCKREGGSFSSFSFRKKLIETLAQEVRKMHLAGLNHRDCYICHFLLDEKKWNEEKKVLLYVIDLHRAQIRKKVPFRYLVKDLAGLYFSGMQYGNLSRYDVCRFLKIYFEKPLSVIFQEEKMLLEKIETAAGKVYKKDMKKEMPPLFLMAGK